VAAKRGQGGGGDLVRTAEQDGIARPRRPGGRRHRVSGAVELAIRCAEARPDEPLAKLVGGVRDSAGRSVDLLGAQPRRTAAPPAE